MCEEGYVQDDTMELRMCASTAAVFENECVSARLWRDIWVWINVCETVSSVQT